MVFTISSGISEFEIRECGTFLHCQTSTVLKENYFHIWYDGSEIGRAKGWTILISLSLLRFPEMSLLVYLSHDICINVLNHCLVIWAKTNKQTNMLVYSKELSKRLNRTPRTSYLSHYVSKSARLRISWSVPCFILPFPSEVLWLNSTFPSSIAGGNSLVKIFKKEECFFLQ